MKSDIIRNAKLLIVIFLFSSLLVSCGYQEIVDEEYPEQLIYMPAAINGIFYINTVALPITTVPTPGNNYRYLVDISGNKFKVPLAAYRSGANNDGGFKVEISVNTDTITKLINTGNLPSETQILASDKYTIPTSVNMPSGEELATFDLDVTLDYLLENYPNGIFAIGVSISSPERKVNPLLATTIVVIDTKMMKPKAEFTSTVAGSKVTFTNISLMSVGNSWNFGDGSPISTEKSPTHTYAASGTYVVTLSAIGVTGEQDKSVIAANVLIP